jgi:hypothetical protein
MPTHNVTAMPEQRVAQQAQRAMVGRRRVTGQPQGEADATQREPALQVFSRRAPNSGFQTLLGLGLAHDPYEQIIDRAA